MKPSPEVRMALNAQRWLAEAGFPPTIVLVDPAPKCDHCFLVSDPIIVAHANEVMDKWTFMTRSKDHQPLGFATARAGWRERRGTWAAQLIHHYDPIGTKEFLELDFDSGNPNWGVAPAFWHGLHDWLYQKLTGARTNPFSVAKHRGWTITDT